MNSPIFGRDLVLQAVYASEAAAVGAWSVVGRGDEKTADEAATRAMWRALSELDIKGLVVIGEGERGEASELYVGEKVGTGKGPRIDIALDALEGTSLAAKSMAGALAVMAWVPAGTMLNVPRTYMDKIACGPGYPEGLLDLDLSAAENAEALAAAKGIDVAELSVCVLDRPRHAEIIASLREVGAKVCLIGDGDVAGVINAANADTGVDMYVGQGGAPEGVLACAALKCVGGQFQGRLAFRTPEERARAKERGILDLERKYDLKDLVRADAIFVATGVTTGPLLEGVRTSAGFVHSHTLVMSSLARTVREIRTKHPV